MGRFKPLLPFGQTTVVESTIQYLRDANVSHIVLVVGHRENALRELLRNQELVFIVNARLESPMSESVKLGIQAVPASSKVILVTPVDYPALSSQVVSELIQSWHDGTRLVIPTWNERGGHPVLIDSSFREELLHLDSDLRSFFATHACETRRLPVSSPFVVRDIDTWDDYVKLHQDFFGFPPKEVSGGPLASPTKP